MADVLVKYSLHWPDQVRVQGFVIETLDESNFALLKDWLPPEDFARPTFWLSRHPQHAITYMELEDGTRRVTMVSFVEAYRRHWSCRRHRATLLSWEPQHPSFKLW